MASLEVEQATIEDGMASLPQMPEETEEPARALFLVSDEEQPDSQVCDLGPKQEIRKVVLKRNLGTMVLGLDRRVLRRVLSDTQLKDLTRFGFEPKPNPHITVVNFNNASMLLNALGGHRRKLAAVKKEADDIDWTWRSTGILVPFHGRQTGALKIVNLVDCPGIEEFNQRMEDNLPGLVLERHPPHVTIMKGPNQLKDKNLIIGGVAIGKPLHTLDHLRPQ